jgi:hypothetical protein
MITAIYAGILGLLALAIGLPIGHLRGKLGIPLGDGGNQQLLLAMRRHGNFMEWVPLALLLIALLEMNGAPRLAVDVLGGSLVAARVVHATGLRSDTMRGVGRFAGAAGTALVVAVASVWLIVRATSA